jgi:hypothetical protein
MARLSTERCLERNYQEEVAREKRVVLAEIARVGRRSEVARRRTVVKIKFPWEGS